MADDKIYNKVITIEAKEEAKTTNGNTMVKITDHTGERFSFFKKKKDGSTSAVAEQFKNMSLDEGSTVRIGYVIETYQDKKGVTRESHKIINFQETDEEPAGGQTPSQTASQAKTSNSEAPVASERLSEAEFSRRLGVQGHVNALLSNPNVVDATMSEGRINYVVKAAIEIEDEINKQLNPSKLRQAVSKYIDVEKLNNATNVIQPEELSTIQQDGGFNPMVNDDPPFTDDEAIPF